MEDALKQSVSSFINCEDANGTSSLNIDLHFLKTNASHSSEGKFSAVPDFMAQIIVAKWPRKHNKAIESSNRLLFAVVSTVIGWINFIKGSIMVILWHKCLVFILRCLMYQLKIPVNLSRFISAESRITI